MASAALPTTYRRRFLNKQSSRPERQGVENPKKSPEREIYLELLTEVCKVKRILMP